MANSTLDDRVWTEEQALAWLTQNPTRADAAEPDDSQGPAIHRHSMDSNVRSTPKDREARLIERRKEFFEHPLTAHPLVWVWLAISNSPRANTTYAARRALCAWITTKLSAGLVPCLKFKSVRRLGYVDVHNGYPAFHLALVPFMKGHPHDPVDQWEVTFTRIRPDAPHRDAEQALLPKKRLGGSSGCDRFVRAELKKLARDGSGDVTKLGAAPDMQRQYRLRGHRSALAEELAARSAEGGRGYKVTTILKSLSKYAISPKGPAA